MTRNLSGPRAFLPSATLWMALVFPNTAPALDFAPPGTTGTLTLKIEAAGTAKHKTPPGSGLDAREWIIKNSGQFTIRLKSVEPVGDISPENQAKAGAVRGAYEKTVTEKDQDIIDKWQEKSDACNSNEVCENRVQAQMMSDPAYQRIIQKMQGAGPEILAAAQAVNVGLRYQLWQSDPMDASPASGSLLLDYTKKEYGVIDTGGGGKVDGTCRWSGNLKIASGSAESKVGTRVLVDAKTSQYEIRGLRRHVDGGLRRQQDRCPRAKQEYDLRTTDWPLPTPRGQGLSSVTHL
jgi:hypothetical protein